MTTEPSCAASAIQCTFLGPAFLMFISQATARLQNQHASCITTSSSHRAPAYDLPMPATSDGGLYKRWKSFLCKKRWRQLFGYDLLLLLRRDADLPRSHTSGSRWDHLGAKALR